MAKTSLRTLAEKCGLSVSTVSRALSGHPNVRAAVRERVQAEAKRCGYTRNQLVGTLMAHVRTARTERFQGNLALVHVALPENPRPSAIQQIMIDAAQARAQELGFHLEVLSFDRATLSAPSLGRMLHARGVQGVVLLYPRMTDSTQGFPWEYFAVAAIDHGTHSLFIPTVSIDHYLTLDIALTRLRALGYQNMGFFIERHKDARVLNKWSATFRSFQETQGNIGHVPMLLEDKMTPEAFLPWYRRHKPDLVIGHVDKAVAWLSQAGRAVPKTTGYFNLNWNERTRACAGFDLRPELQGVLVVESVVAQIHRNERGPPTDPYTVMVPGRWVDGPTLRTK